MMPFVEAPATYRRCCPVKENIRFLLGQSERSASDESAQSIHQFTSIFLLFSREEDTFYFVRFVLDLRSLT